MKPNTLISILCFTIGVILAIIDTGGVFNISKKDTAIQNKIFTVNGISFSMIAVEGGNFTMGCTAEQGEDCYDDEMPSVDKYVANFMIGETEVTQLLWNSVMESNPSEFKGRPNNPVEKVSWNKCQEFINRLNQLTGENFRLPTEAEWEYAARGGKKTIGYKYSGSNTCENVAWCKNNSGGKTHTVKSKIPNELGIYDMSGNVYEWCQDYYIDANGIRKEGSHVLRGGCWSGTNRNERVSYRYYAPAENPSSRSGFRLALSVK